jgi:hypothetical protein
VYEYTFADLDLEASPNTNPLPAASAWAAAVQLDWKCCRSARCRRLCADSPHRMSSPAVTARPRYNAVIDFVPADLPALAPNLQPGRHQRVLRLLPWQLGRRPKLAFPNLHGNTRFDVNSA